LSLLVSSELKAQELEFCGGNSSWSDPFDWQQETFPMYLSPQGFQNIPNPYHSSGAFLNPNIQPLSWPGYKDYNPSDGWVHIAHDFGKPLTNVPNPHLILYNRGTGLLRVFFLVTQLYDQNNRATVSVRFGNGSKKTAVLEQYGSTTGMNALSKFENYSVEGLVPNEFSNALPYWVFADFVMTYDPCSCSITNSTLYVELKLYKKEILNFTINGQLQQELKSTTTGSYPTFTSTLKPFNEGFTKINNILSGTATLVANTQREKKTSGFSAFSQILGLYAGPWAGLADFVIGLFDSPQSATPVPLVFNATFDANGSVDWVGTSKTAIILNPGTSTSGIDITQIPPYNKPLGTYNLLTPPKVNIVKSFNGYAGLTPQDCDIDITYYRFELTQPIKWIYNPRMPLADVEWRAAYVITFSDGKRVLTEDYPLGCMQDYKPVFKAVKRLGSCRYIEPYPVRAQIQVLAKSWLENGAKSIFLQVYNCDQTTINDGSTYLQTVRPSPGCNNYSDPATSNEIQSVCYSSAYRARTATLTSNDSIPEEEYLANVAQNAKSLLVTKTPVVSIENQLRISPNPINEMGVINCELSTDSKVSIYLTDISGKTIRSFIQNDFKKKGVLTIDFLRNNLTAGMYFVVLETELGRVTQKLILK
jgi:hypothetical protein